MEWCDTSMGGKSITDGCVSNLAESSGAFPGSLPRASGEGSGTTCPRPPRLCRSVLYHPSVSTLSLRLWSPKDRNRIFLSSLCWQLHSAWNIVTAQLRVIAWMNKRQIPAYMLPIICCPSRQTQGLPRWLSKESVCQCGEAGDVGSVPELGRSPGGGHGNPLEYSCLETPTDQEVWWITVHGVSDRTEWLSMHTCRINTRIVIKPKCPSTEKWIKKMWHIFTIEYYSTIKRNETGSFVEMWMT